MKSDIGEIAKSAKSLSRSPLGIIALFLVLVYAMASLFVGFRDLSPVTLGVFVGFLVLFPLVVLAVFYNLVTKHHDKLYAPTDYRTDSSFLHALEASLRRRSTTSPQSIIEATAVKLSNQSDTPAIQEELSQAVARASLQQYGYLTIKVLAHALQGRVQIVLDKQKQIAMTVFDSVTKGAYHIDHFFSEFLHLHGSSIIAIESMEPFRFTVADFAKNAIFEAYAELQKEVEEEERRTTGNTQQNNSADS